MERIEDMTWRSDTGRGSLADVCAGYFGSSPESGEHIRMRWCTSHVRPHVR